MKNSVFSPQGLVSDRDGGLVVVIPVRVNP